jgi:hypothetical protein
MNILIVSVIKVIQNLSSDYNTIGAISGTGTVYTSGASAFTSSSHFIGVHGGRSLVFCTVLWNIVRLLYLFAWTLYFELRLTIIPLVFSNICFKFN